jgi:peroxiredoxin (alkyl hydroperoxide reductase subunit C)
MAVPGHGDSDRFWIDEQQKNFSIPIKMKFIMGLHIGDTAPDFTAETSTGDIRFHDWIGQSWVFFFSHPGDFTPVCTTEIGRTAQLATEFQKRNVKPLGLSTDGVAEHLLWIKDVNDTQHTTVTFPIVADPDSTAQAARPKL